MRSDLTMVGMPEEGTAVGESDRVLSLLQRHYVSNSVAVYQAMSAVLVYLRSIYLH